MRYKTVITSYSIHYTKLYDNGRYFTELITGKAIEYIREASSDNRPFFLYVAYNAVHAPAQAPEQDIQNQTGDKTRDTLMAIVITSYSIHYTKLYERR